MLEDAEKEYKNAVAKLNGLQSNSQTIAAMRIKRQEMQALNENQTRLYMDALNITQEKLGLLKAIHVSGTKGKGTTCAYVESILRHCGQRTGFYSSPHLVHARERIRIDGKAISKQAFAQRFFEIYEKIEIASEKHQIPMHAYYKFLTLMAFHTFLEEHVDVAIIEVGIGGEFDCTNVLKNPVVCGITTLDIDHTSLLGSTIPEIAWQKAGIMKTGRPCFTVSQLPAAWAVFKERAAERSTAIFECVPFADHQWTQKITNYVEERGRHHEFNIGLAIELANFWLKDQKIREYEVDGAGDRKTVPRVYELGILETEWLGRNQVLNKGNITYFLDGAHTPKSIQYCAEWSSKLLNKTDKSSHALRILLFHCTADRDPATMLPVLVDRIHFDLALFCPTRLLPVLDPQNDNTNLNQSEDEQWQKCLRAKDTWKSLTLRSNRQIRKSFGFDNTVEIFPCISDSIARIHVLAENNSKVEVLVTGSLHLVGGVLSFEGPDTCSS